jgi:hypothetical protein
VIWRDSDFLAFEGNHSLRTKIRFNKFKIILDIINKINDLGSVDNQDLRTKIQFSSLSSRKSWTSSIWRDSDFFALVDDQSLRKKIHGQQVQDRPSKSADDL